MWKKVGRILLGSFKKSGHFTNGPTKPFPARAFLNTSVQVCLLSLLTLFHLPPVLFVAHFVFLTHFVSVKISRFPFQNEWELNQRKTLEKHHTCKISFCLWVLFCFVWKRKTMCQCWWREWGEKEGWNRKEGKTKEKRKTSSINTRDQSKSVFRKLMNLNFCVKRWMSDNVAPATFRKTEITHFTTPPHFTHITFSVHESCCPHSPHTFYFNAFSQKSFLSQFLSLHFFSLVSTSQRQNNPHFLHDLYFLYLPSLRFQIY